MDEDLKRCSNCKIEQLVINFHKNKLPKDGVRSECTNCRKKSYDESQEKTKKCYLENRDRI